MIEGSQEGPIGVEYSNDELNPGALIQTAEIS
jgi:hypothetical protein